MKFSSIFDMTSMWGKLRDLLEPKDPKTKRDKILKLREIDKFLELNLDKIESIAITSQFSTRNPDHENMIKEYIRKKVQLPITCSHDLTFNLNGPKRAITCVLNASLANIIDRLIRMSEK